MKYLSFVAIATAAMTLTACVPGGGKGEPVAGCACQCQGACVTGAGVTIRVNGPAADQPACTKTTMDACQAAGEPFASANCLR